MRRRRRVLALVAAAALAGTLAFPSGAAPLFSGPTDRVGSDVELAPSSEYAYLADGELVVDISASNPEMSADGLNPDSVTAFEDVFRVRYTGSEYAHVWLSHDSGAVTFRVDGRPIQSAAANVTLAPNESVAVDLLVDTRGEGPGGLVDDVTVHATVADPEAAQADGEANDASAPAFDGPTVQSRAPTPDSRRFTVLGAEPGRTHTLEASALALDRAGGGALTLDELAVGNADGSLSLAAAAVDAASSRALVADAGAQPLGAARVTVDAGDVKNATLRFSVPQSYLDARDVAAANLSVYRDDGGELEELDVSATGERDGRVRFEADAPGFSTFVVAADRARLRVAAVSLNRSVAGPGEAVAVTATVANEGTLRGDRTVALSVDGEVVAERTVSVAAGETAAVTVPVARAETGEFAVAVDGVDAGTFAVEAADETGAGTTTRAPGDETPARGGSPADGVVEEPAGFGLSESLGVVTLLAVVAATLFLARRASWR